MVVAAAPSGPRPLHPQVGPRHRGSQTPPRPPTCSQRRELRATDAGPQRRQRQGQGSAAGSLLRPAGVTGTCLGSAEGRGATATLAMTDGRGKGVVVALIQQPSQARVHGDGRGRKRGPGGLGRGPGPSARLVVHLHNDLGFSS